MLKVMNLKNLTSEVKWNAPLALAQHAKAITPLPLHHQYAIPWVWERRPLFHTLLQQLLDAGKLLELLSLWIYKKYATFQDMTWWGGSMVLPV